MVAKTHSTAVVLIPPMDIWEPIQAIRQTHDRHFRRWMPHITLLYPFRPRDEFTALADEFTAVCMAIDPFDIELAELRFFRHRRENFTLWLAPEPRESVVRLQTILEGIVPDCDEVSRQRGGFTPHVSVGQAHGEQQMQALKMKLQAKWQPLTFTAQEIHLIWRLDPPNDVFQIGETVRLGVGEAGPQSDREAALS